MMPADEIPIDIRRRLRWLPHLPYHKALGRRSLAAITFFGSFFQFRGDARVKAWWVHHGNKGCKVYQPVDKRTDAIMLWIHGGGYIGLAASLDDQFCRRVVEELGITLVSAEYRLAPKHRFPAGLDDCQASWQWILDHAADLGCDPSRSIVAGESAGGGLAAALAQRVHDEGGTQPLAQILVAPMLDDRTALREELTREHHYIWNNQNNHGGWACYLGQEPGQAEVPRYSVPARRSLLAGLPPAWIGIGTADLFFDESVEYANRLKDEGVDCELALAKGGVHAFHGIHPEAEISISFWASLLAFARQNLAIA